MRLKPLKLNHLFLEKTKKAKKTKKNKKTKKTKKTIFSKTMGLGPPKDGFFGFLEKKMVFLVRNHLFLEKKMVFEQPLFEPYPGKTIFEKPSFGKTREKDGFSKDGCSKTIFVSRKRWFPEVLSW